MSYVTIDTPTGRKMKWTSVDIRKKKGDINIVYGGKNVGKSYDVKKYCIERAFKGKGEHDKIVYMRRWEDETKPRFVNKYFNGVKAKGVIKEVTKGKYNNIFTHTGSLYFGNYDLNGSKPIEIREVECGYTMGLNCVEKYASLELEDAGNMIYEEWQTTGRYLTNEPFELRRLKNTIERDGKITLWMIANNISYVCPYVQDWGLVNLPKQLQGTIDVYNIPTGTYDPITKEPNYNKICVEYVGITDDSSGFIVNEQQGDMISQGNWYEDLYPTYPYIEGLENVIYQMIMQYNGFMFLLRLIYDERQNDLFWYVEEKPEDVEIDGLRIVGNVYHPGLFYTRYFQPLNKQEATAFQMIDRGQVRFKNNLCGTTFHTALKNIKNS